MTDRCVPTIQQDGYDNGLAFICEIHDTSEPVMVDGSQEYEVNLDQMVSLVSAHHAQYYDVDIPTEGPGVFKPPKGRTIREDQLIHKIRQKHGHVPLGTMDALSLLKSSDIIDYTRAWAVESPID